MSETAVEDEECLNSCKDDTRSESSDSDDSSNDSSTYVGGRGGGGGGEVNFCLYRHHKK